MIFDSPPSSPSLKRQKFSTVAMDPFAKEKLTAAKEKLGREIRVFETTPPSSTAHNVQDTEETDDFYEFTPEDYYRVLATRKEDKFLKTKKIREAEEAARRSRITKAVIRVRFPDNITLEATFHPSETIQSLIDLLMKVLSRPDVPFYIYTTPPKKQISDMSRDFYSAGFAPGAIVYFSYDMPKGEDGAVPSGPFLQDEVMALKGIEIITEHEQYHNQSGAESVVSAASPSVQEPKPAAKKAVKPKWLKM